MLSRSKSPSGEGRPGAVQPHDVEREAELGGDGARGDRQVENVAGDPEGLEVRHRPARGEMAPRPGGVVADHPGQLRGHLELEARRHRRRLGQQVVRVVEHRREVADLRGDGLLEHHVAHVPAAEEGHVPLELGQQPHQLLGEGRDGVVVAGAPLVGLADDRAVLGVIVPAPEDVVAERLGDQTLEQVRVLGAGSQEPGAERLAGVRHGADEASPRGLRQGQESDHRSS
jgi:hypothetical protein